MPTGRQEVQDDKSIIKHYSLIDKSGAMSFNRKYCHVQKNKFVVHKSLSKNTVPGSWSAFGFLFRAVVPISSDLFRIFLSGHREIWIFKRLVVGNQEDCPLSPLE